MASTNKDDGQVSPLAKALAGLYPAELLREALDILEPSAPVVITEKLAMDSAVDLPSVMGGLLDGTIESQSVEEDVCELCGKPTGFGMA